MHVVHAYKNKRRTWYLSCPTMQSPFYLVSIIFSLKRLSFSFILSGENLQCAETIFFFFYSLPLIPTSVPKAIMSCSNILLLEYGWAMNSDTILFISVSHGKLLPGMRLRKNEAGRGFLGLESWFVYRFLVHHDKTWVSEQFFGGPCSSPDPCFLAFFSLFFLFSNSWTLFKHSGAEMFHPCDF